MAINLFLNRSVFSNEGTTSFSQAVLAVTDDQGAFTFNQAFAGATGVAHHPSAPSAAETMANWALSLAQTDDYQDAGLHVGMFSLGVTPNWDPNNSISPGNDASYVELTSAMQVTTPQNPAPNPQVLPLRLENPGDFQMLNVQKDASNNFNPSWLSADTRTFRVNASSNTTNAAGGQPGVQLPISAALLWGANPNLTTWNAADAAFAVQALKTYFENNPVAASTFFDSLDKNEDGGSLFEEHDLENAKPVYNFAIVRVHANSTGVLAIDAQICLRIYTTLSGGLGYDPTAYAGPNYKAVNSATTSPHYPPNGWPVGAKRIAAVGRSVNNDPVSIPFFGDARTPVGTGEDEQPDATNALHIPVTTTGPTTHFGVFHVDINDPVSLRYTDAGGNGRRLYELVNQPHNCMVAEIISVTDQTPAGATPQSSGNLAQRNLAIDYINNPGLDPNVRTVQHNFEFVPRKHEKASPEERPNELLFLTKNAPRGTTIDLFMPDLAAKKSFHPGAKPALGHAPPHPVAIDDHTVSFGGHRAARLPIKVAPGGRYPALLTVHFPAGTDVGQKYDIDVLQLDPVLGIVVGAFRISTPVVKARTRVGAQYAAADAAVHRAQSAKPESSWGRVLARQARFAQAKARSTAIEMVHEVGGISRSFVTVVLDRIEVPIARKEPIVVTAAVYEGGQRVATHAVRIPAGAAGMVNVAQPIFEGLMLDHLMVKLLDGATTGPVLHEKAWTAMALASHDHVEGISDNPHPSSWKVWFHVTRKEGLPR